MSNPGLQLELQDARLRLKAAEAAYTSLRVQMQNDYLQQQAAATSIESDFKRATMQAEVNEQLASQQLLSSLTLRQSRLDVQEREAQMALSRMQLASHAESMQARLDSMMWDVWLRADRDGVLELPGRASVEVPDLREACDLIGFSYYSATGVDAEGKIVP